MLRGFEEWLEENPRGRFCMLNRRNYTRNGHDWNPMPDMELESLRGGSYYLKGDSQKGGFGRTPRTPPGYGPDYHTPTHQHPVGTDGRTDGRTEHLCWNGQLVWTPALGLYL